MNEVNPQFIPLSESCCVSTPNISHQLSLFLDYAMSNLEKSREAWYDSKPDYSHQIIILGEEVNEWQSGTLLNNRRVQVPCILVTASILLPPSREDPGSQFLRK